MTAPPMSMNTIAASKGATRPRFIFSTRKSPRKPARIAIRPLPRNTAQAKVWFRACSAVLAVGGNGTEHAARKAVHMWSDCCVPVTCSQPAAKAPSPGDGCLAVWPPCCHSPFMLTPPELLAGPLHECILSATPSSSLRCSVNPCWQALPLSLAAPPSRPSPLPPPTHHKQSTAHLRSRA